MEPGKQLYPEVLAIKLILMLSFYRAALIITTLEAYALTSFHQWNGQTSDRPFSIGKKEKKYW